MAKTAKNNNEPQNSSFNQYTTYDYQKLQDELILDIIKYKDRYNFEDILTSLVSKYSETILNNSLHHQKFLISKITESHAELGVSQDNEARLISRVKVLTNDLLKLSNRLAKAAL